MTTSAKNLPAMKNRGGVETLLLFGIAQGSKSFAPKSPKGDLSSPPFGGRGARAKTALALFLILFSGSSLMETYSQGLIQANGNDIAYTMRRFGVQINNPVLPFEVNGSGKFYKNLFVDSLITSWHIQTQQIEAATAIITGDLSADKLTVSSTVLFNSLSGSGDGLVGVDTSGTLIRYNMTGNATDYFRGDGTFGNLSIATGWQLVGGTLLSTVNDVAIPGTLSVGHSINIGSFRFKNSALINEADSVITDRNIHIMTLADKIAFEADTVTMREFTRVGSDTSKYAPPVTGKLALEVAGSATVIGDVAVKGAVSSDAVKTNNVVANKIESKELTADSLTVNNSIKVKRILPLAGDSIVRIGHSSINIFDFVNRIYPTTNVFIFHALGPKGLCLGNFRNPNYAPSVGWQQFTASNAFAEGSLAMGFLVGTEQNAKNAIVIGSGDSIYANGSLINNKPNSLMIGFNSNIPSLYVEPSTGIGTTGNIGIGTTEPGAKLHVSNTVNPAQIGLGVNSSMGGYTYLGIGLSAVSGGHSTLQSVKSAGTAYGDLVLNPSGGNVGIGTTSPDAQLHLRIQGYPSSSFAESQGSLFKVQQSSNSDWAAEIYNNGGGGKGLRILADGGSPVPLLQVDDATVGGSTRFVVMGNGKVGIGTPTPYSALHVIAPANEVGLIVETNFGANWAYGILEKVTGDNTKAFAVENNGLETFKLMGNGNLYASRLWTQTPPFPDFVMNKNYRRPTWQEKENYYWQFGRLMYMPSAEEVAKKGLDISSGFVGLTQNVEENSLDINDILKRLEKMEKENAEKDKKIKRLEKELGEFRKMKK